MRLHLGARLHAAAHGLFRSKDESEVRALSAQVEARFDELGLGSKQGRDELIANIVSDVAEPFGVFPEDHRRKPIAAMVSALIDGEAMFILPEADWSKKRSIAEWWELRDALSYQKRLAGDFDTVRHLTVQLAGLAVQQLYEACPALYQQPSQMDGITAPSNVLYAAGDVADITENILGLVFADDLIEAELFQGLRGKLQANLIAASGGNPNDPSGFSKAIKHPAQIDARSPEQLIATYLGGTLFTGLFDQSLDITIPTKVRFEHHHIVAGSGHGKTQTLQYLIANDLEVIARGERSIVVIDSQGDLINNISRLSLFAKGGALHDKIVVIDPSDVEWPVSLNLFDVGIERLQSYPPLEQERLTNSILELYNFVLGSLLDAAMTQKQSVIFRYVTRLMLHIPGATIHTLRELMEPGAEVKFAEHIEKLTGTARQFFKSEFTSKEFDQTKQQVLRRLWGILENQTFERMFSHPTSKLDLFAEMNAGKIILINTAKDLLKEQGSQIFGRFFIAMIAQAAQERATLPENKRMPTLVYVDEAQDYFDANIEQILAQARKQKVGMVLAHQYLSQLDSKLHDALAANTSIKFAGGVSNKDARSLAPMLHTEPEAIESQPKGSFASYVRGVTKSAVPLSFPFGVLESEPRMSAYERDQLQQLMRVRYAVHYSELGQADTGAPSAERAEKEEAPEADGHLPEGQINTDPGSEW